MSRSRVTLATMEAAATDTQVTSPLTTVRTWGRGVAVAPADSASTGSLT